MARAALLLAIVVMMIASARSFLPDETSLVGSGAALAFGFVLLAAIQTGTIFSGIGLPKLTGYLVLGFLAGPGLFNMVTPRMLADLKLVNNVAIGLIALSTGAELNLRRLWPRMRAVLTLSGGCFFLTAFLCATAMFVLPYVPFVNRYIEFFASMNITQRAAVSLLVGVVAACLSPTVTLALINETASKGPFCELALGIVVISDILILIAFSGTMALVSSLFSGGDGAHDEHGMRTLFIHVFGSFGVGAVVGALFVVYMKRVNQRIALFAFAVCFICAEAGTKLHLSPLLTCLTAGLVIENLSDLEGNKLIHDIEPARIPVFAVFFAVAGAGLHWHAVAQMLPVVVILVVTRLLGNSVGARFFGAVAGVSPEYRKRVAAVLFSQSGIAIGLAVLVEKQFPGWGASLATCLLGVVMTNEMIGPVVLRSALLKSEEAGTREDMEGVVADH
jgi:Kef-type K+ transport system membrane component KefB